MLATSTFTMQPKPDLLASDLARALIRAHADVRACREDGSSALFLGRAKGLCSYAEVLLDAGAYIVDFDSSALLVAAGSGHEDVTKLLLDRYATQPAPFNADEDGE